jgi:gluconate 5-dehydrogenase
MENVFSLKGKVALVTGGSRGIGWAITRALAAAGAHVVVNGRDPKALEARVGELAAEGLSASAAAFDVGDEKAVVRVVAETAERHGHLDIAVANAGINHRVALTDFATADFQRVLDVNLNSYFVLAREAARPMIRQKSGRLIVVASMMGPIARPGIAAYVASKGGAAALTKALAVELGEHGITCNAICPGFTRTDMTQIMQDNPQITAWVEGRTPLKRWAEPREVASVAVFLASDAASYITGHSLNVDGGFAINA